MNARVSFGPFHFEPSTARLWSGDREVRLTRKAAHVLARLVARAGEPVTKQELFSSVWGRTVVGDDALVSCIQELRKALEDDPQRPRYIQTRHRVGYQFIGSPPPALPAATAAEAASIAVLPFKDLSAEHDQAYFCEGLAEELLNALTHVDGVRVTARSAAFRMHAGSDPRRIGRKLGVDSLLTGSVRRLGERVRITVQLVEVASGFHKWSRRFERELGNLFAIQDEIAETVAGILRGADLSGREREALRRPPTAIATYEYYLRGRQGLSGLERSELLHSAQMFEQALAVDPAYAPAWAGLAFVHAWLFEWWGSEADNLARADQAAQRAMHLAPELADSHVARGLACSLQRRHDEARTHFQTAIEINPNLFDAYYFFGRSCFARGNVAESVDLFCKASQVRREDFQSAILAAQSLRMLGRAGEAAALNQEGAIRARRALALNPRDVRALSIGAIALYEAQEVATALEWSQRAVDLYPEDVGALVNAACIRARQGLKEEALQILERVFGRGWGKAEWVDHDPDYDSLRDDPRFQRLREKL
ncbi:MAG: winged helix-turn-helix domain-containing protein [Proteobacteria bacterium]|nr:winged helix-turn-helix domain-containing protein [Pseudomonadota bacterium]